MITFDLSTLLDFPSIVTEFAEEFCFDYDIENIGDFIARASKRIGPDLDAAIYSTVQVIDGRLVLQASPHRRALGHFVQVHQDMVREGAA
ncbi:hypothetical protein P7B04_25995 [Sphingobium yanoikuyae]|uniref:hypothetical protein n=1 Tax=Sphingobium yanoikuyae TaxID=13690 RepID=UPI0003788608|nr:hypothetical protein [Sphingobium yanoikuyae]MDG2516120.1 hypothetical protein [Sphingobium yanoikuyae]RSU78042.1 hypothetical protein BRX37_05955 [Sphingomonas sp. S-NIH.Pt3_0716]